LDRRGVRIPLHRLQPWRCEMACVSLSFRSREAKLMTCYMYERLYTGFGLVIGLTELLQIVTISNYSAIAISHTERFTTEGPVFSVCCVFTSLRLVTASNSVASSASAFTPLLAGDSLTTNSKPRLVLLITPRHGPHGKQPSQELVYCGVT
jgi:hypothetical protein